MIREGKGRDAVRPVTRRTLFSGRLQKSIKLRNQGERLTFEELWVLEINSLRFSGVPGPWFA